MPIHEFQCPQGHVTEKLFRSFSSVTETLECATCKEEATQIPGVPCPAHFLGNPDGYYKPSPTKRFNTKLVSEKTGNKCSIG